MREFRTTRALLIGAFLIAFVAFVCQGTHAFGQSNENAQAKPTSAVVDASSAFRSVQGARNEQVPGGLFLVAAYGVVWLLIFAYIININRLQTKTQRDLDRLEQIVASTHHSGHGETEKR